MNQSNEEQIKTLFATAILLTRKWEVIVNRTHPSDDLTLKQLMLLIVAGKAFVEDPTIKQVSSMMATSHQNVKAILLQLEKKGFVKMYQDTNDKRIVRIHVSKDKQDYWDQRDEKDRETLAALFEGISLDDLETTCRVISQLDETAKAMLGF